MLTHWPGFFLTWALAVAAVVYCNLFIVFDRCLENVYALRYEETLARLQRTEQTASSLDTVMTTVDDDDDFDDDASMNSD